MAVIVTVGIHGVSRLAAQEPVAQPKVVLGQDPTTKTIPATLSPSADSGSQKEIPEMAREANLPGFNAAILEAIRTMPKDGQYRTTLAAVSALRNSIQVVDSHLVVDPTRAIPSFCSGATYLVFVSALRRLSDEGRLPMNSATLAQLLVRDHQADGAGIWGRWNANGPGTARFFYETGLGHNFTSFDEARAGDFMKVFWTDEIGSREFGHSVIYLGRVHRPEGEFISFWSSNQPNGFSTREVPRQRIRRALFSRLEVPENIRHVATMPARDSYLASMLKRPSSEDEMRQMVGVTDSEPAAKPAQTPVTLQAHSTPSPSAAGQSKSPTPGVHPIAPATPVVSNPATPPPAKKPWYKKLLGQ